jgi:hypothetical protein
MTDIKEYREIKCCDVLISNIEDAYEASEINIDLKRGGVDGC